jgi:MFS family permease
MTDAGTPGQGRSPALILATLCSANFMATMDVFIVNVSLHSIGVGFGGEVLSNVAWVLSAYAIVFGALLRSNPSYLGALVSASMDCPGLRVTDDATRD